MVCRLRWPRNAQCLAKCSKVGHTHPLLSGPAIATETQRCDRFLTLYGALKTMSAEAALTPKSGADAQGRRLESWKEIATYLGRDVTTVRRWEKGEGLPVHRHLHNKLGSVYGYTTEPDGWRSNGAPVPPTDALDTDKQPATDTGPIAQPVPWGNYTRTAALAALNDRTSCSSSKYISSLIRCVATRGLRAICAGRTSYLEHSC
jgi:hypothetical protein